jgi:transcriptional regulator with XRE-family HTH domain
LTRSSDGGRDAGRAELRAATPRDGTGLGRGRRQEIEAEARRIRLRGEIEGWPRDAIVDEMLRQLPDVTALEAHRFAHGWTREELSQAVDLLYVTDGLEAPQLTPAELCRWEHGQRRPSDERREFLCRVYRTRPDRLGFGSDHTASAAHQIRRPPAGRRVSRKISATAPTPSSAAGSIRGSGRPDA